ncbi:unnamed protein product, partial [Mesorhabditis belari]|uniref:Uncharacterized protein n=1 Tax=Mesorhabditis belari TaxID=2138241 RepID=A0AAF3ES62_9BILA
MISIRTLLFATLLLVLAVLCDMAAAQSDEETQFLRQFRAPSPKFIRFGRAGQKFIRFGRSANTWDDSALDDPEGIDLAMAKRAGQKFIRFG